MIARYLVFREIGFSHTQARALADAGYVVTSWQWVALP